MLGRFILLFGLISITASAQAQSFDCSKSEAACVLDAAWSAALVLPEEKRERLMPAFLEVATLSDDSKLQTFWESRFSRTAELREPYPDYGWQKAEPILNQSGVDGLIDRARSRQAPLSFGRTDALLSAGKRLHREQPAASLKLNRALIDLSRSASDFERPNLAHAATELAMVRCDMAMFGEASALTDAPQNLRYAFWRARMERGALDLLNRVRGIDNDTDTREVRRVLDGYRAILEFGYCDQSAAAIGG
ncbi:MAG: hypothetical protein AAF996_13175 [Pseudomonadota bacterium]